MIFFIYNIRRATSPRADRGVRSPQSFHIILVLTLNYHVFLTTVAFRNTYPNQPYTSHALHAISSSNKPYCSVLGIHFTTRVAPTTIRREHNKGVLKFWVDTNRKTKNTTTLYIMVVLITMFVLYWLMKACVWIWLENLWYCLL